MQRPTATLDQHDSYRLMARRACDRRPPYKESPTEAGLNTPGRGRQLRGGLPVFLGLNLLLLLADGLGHLLIVEALQKRVKINHRPVRVIMESLRYTDQRGARAQIGRGLRQRQTLCSRRAEFVAPVRHWYARTQCFLTGHRPNRQSRARHAWRMPRWQRAAVFCCPCPRYSNRKCTSVRSLLRLRTWRQ